jgi:hypothetical protein
MIGEAEWADADSPKWFNVFVDDYPEHSQTVETDTDTEVV